MVKNWFKADCNKLREINETNECINNKLKHRNRIINTWKIQGEETRKRDKVQV